jgi:hypothetical protein
LAVSGDIRGVLVARYLQLRRDFVWFHSWRSRPRFSEGKLQVNPPVFHLRLPD